MSGGYADRLKHYPNKGVCGLPENYDSERLLKANLRSLVELVRDAKHLVIMTGAGISTSAGIPDFRGPNGIWTVQKAKDQEAKNERKRLKQERDEAEQRKKAEEAAREADEKETDAGPLPEVPDTWPEQPIPDVTEGHDESPPMQ